jgi:hypothetical protein
MVDFNTLGSWRFDAISEFDSARASRECWCLALDGIRMRGAKENLAKQTWSFGKKDLTLDSQIRINKMTRARHVFPLEKFTLV